MGTKLRTRLIPTPTSVQEVPRRFAARFEAKALRNGVLKVRLKDCCDLQPLQTMVKNGM
jgi:hypothetical protein